MLGKRKDTNRKEIKEKAKKIGISDDVFENILKNRNPQSLEEINSISTLYLLFHKNLDDSTFLSNLIEKLQFLFQFGNYSIQQDGIIGKVEIRPNLNYKFRLLVDTNKISSYVTLGNKSIEESYIKEQNFSFVLSTSIESFKKEKMRYGLINKNYDSNRDFIEKKLRVLDKNNQEFLCFKEIRVDDYVINRNTNKKSLNTDYENDNYLYQQYIFRKGRESACEKEIIKEGVEEENTRVFYHIDDGQGFTGTSKFSFDILVKQIKEDKEKAKLMKKVFPNK